jgi:O-methyltransferase
MTVINTYTEEFLQLLKEASGHTLVDPARCHIIYQAIKHIQWLAGEMAEVGVYKGGTARIMGRTSKQFEKNLYLFDTFKGMPTVDNSKDLHKEGDFKDTDMNSVARYLADCKNVHIYEGLFPETGKAIADKKFCLVHIDADIYRSIKESSEFFYPRMVEGGIIIYDDYGAPSCPGAKIAVDEFYKDKQESLLYLPTGQCVVIKTGMVIPAEVDKCRSRLIEYCQGAGIDFGCGGNKIRPEAIGIDHRLLPGVNIVWDLNRYMYTFHQESLNYVFSSHVLEHLQDPRGMIRQWWGILKKGGYLVFYLPHPKLYTEPNPEHIVMMGPEDLVDFFTEFKDYKIERNKTYSTNNEYSFEFVVKKE